MTDSWNPTLLRTMYLHAENRENDKTDDEKMNFTTGYGSVARIGVQVTIGGKAKVRVDIRVKGVRQ